MVDCPTTIFVPPVVGGWRCHSGHPVVACGCSMQEIEWCDLPPPLIASS